MNDQMTSDTPVSGTALISRNGIYDLTNAQYHGQPCDGPSVSASGLKMIIGESPAAFWRQSDLNPAGERGPQKPAFRIGSAAHTLLLEPEKIAAEIAVIPQAMLAVNGSTNTSAAKEFIADAIYNGKTPIKPGEWLDIQHMRDALAAHPHARRALTKGKPEVSLIMRDAATGVWLKSRPDFMPESSGFYIVDYKTTADLSSWDKAACIDLRYDIQAALMLWAAREVAGIEPKGILYLVQEKKPPFQVAMLAFSVDNIGTRALLDCARLDLRQAIDTFDICLKTGNWPTGYELPREITPPGWHQKSAEFRLEQTSYSFEDAYRV